MYLHSIRISGVLGALVLAACTGSSGGSGPGITLVNENPNIQIKHSSLSCIMQRQNACGEYKWSFSITNIGMLSIKQIDALKFAWNGHVVAASNECMALLNGELSLSGTFEFYPDDNPDAGPHERAKLYGGIDQPARCILGQSSILAQSEAAVSSIPPATGSMIQIVVTGLLSDGSPFSTQAMVSAN